MQPGEVHGIAALPATCAAVLEAPARQQSVSLVDPLRVSVEFSSLSSLSASAGEFISKQCECVSFGRTSTPSSSTLHPMSMIIASDAGEFAMLPGSYLKGRVTILQSEQ